MHITSANTGDVLCLYQTGKWIRILDVDDSLITYQEESGDRYATRETHLSAFVDKDPVRLASFDQNSKLGAALNAAEYSAMKKFLSAPGVNHPIRTEANRMLAMIREQKDVFLQRLQEEKSREVPSKELTQAFLSQLYEMGTGSHDTLFGLRVENTSGHLGNFLINGQRYDYDTALQCLSQRPEPKQERKPGLDAQIAVAVNRRRSNETDRDTKRSLDDLTRG